MPEDPVDHGRLLDERDQTQAAAAARTRQHVHPKRACHQRRPTLAASVAPRRLRGVSFASPLGGGSPWSSGWNVPPIPEGNKWQARATFAEPGTYVIRALAHDGGLFSSQNVTVVVQQVVSTP